jgi:hypothetical protein
MLTYTQCGSENFTGQPRVFDKSFLIVQFDRPCYYCVPAAQSLFCGMDTYKPMGNPGPIPPDLGRLVATQPEDLALDYPFLRLSS